MVELDELKKLALTELQHRENGVYTELASPATVLDLIESLERAEQKAAIAERLGKTILDAKNHWADRAVKAEALVTEYQKIIGGECLRLKAGDILVVRFDPRYVPTDSEQYRTLREHLYSLLPPGVHGFFLLADIGLEVISDEQLDRAGLMRKPAMDPAFFDTKLGAPYEPACPSSLHDQPINQCDGCLAGMPINPATKIHADFAGHPVMTCQSDRYTAEPEPAAGWVTSMIPDGESLQDGLDALVVPVRAHKATDAELDDQLADIERTRVRSAEDAVIANLNRKLGREGGAS